MGGYCECNEAGRRHGREDHAMTAMPKRESAELSEHLPYEDGEM